MNFWTFLDRNGLGVLAALAIVGFFTSTAIGACTDSFKKHDCIEAKP